MKKWSVGARSHLGTAGALVCFGVVGCSAADEPKTVEPGETVIERLVGGVPANSSRLDAVGALGITYDYGGWGGSGGTGGLASGGTAGKGSAGGSVSPGGTPGRQAASFAGGPGWGWYNFSPHCTGTLISENSVLTTADCGYLLQQVGESTRVEFAIGPNAYASGRRVEVVDVEFAPAIDGNHVNLAVLHLIAPVTDVQPVALADLTEAQVGEQFAAMGYGVRDRFYQEGTRRVGAVTLRGVEGRLHEYAYGSFEEFYAYMTGGGSGGTGGSGGKGDPTGPGGRPGGFAGAGAMGSSQAGTGADPAAGGFGTGGSGGSAGAAGKGGGGSWEDWYRDYLLEVYNSTLLEPNTAFVGGGSDAQPCGADTGGPLLRSEGGVLTSFGVFTHTPNGECANGALYVRLTPAIREFIEGTLDWVDPCGGLSRAGTCEGNVATRCTSAPEGPRRTVRFDCDLLGQQCLASGVAEVSCVDYAD